MSIVGLVLNGHTSISRDDYILYVLFYSVLQQIGSVVSCSVDSDGQGLQCRGNQEFNDCQKMEDESTNRKRINAMEEMEESIISSISLAFQIWTTLNDSVMFCLINVRVFITKLKKLNRALVI